MEKKEKKEPYKAIFTKQRVIVGEEAIGELWGNKRYGQVLPNNTLQLSLVESLYLLSKGKIKVVDGRNKEVSFEKFVAKASRIEPNFWVRYIVFSDLRKRGYIVKTALKFGADFRVYDRGVKPGEEHAKWIIYAVHEGKGFSWQEFAAKNRVAHSTKKRLMIGIVDDEGDVTYYEVKWVKP